jgi:hypothetical protein
MQDVWAPPILWQLDGLEFWAHMGAGIVAQQYGVCSWSWYAAFELFDSNSFHWSCIYV